MLSVGTFDVELDLWQNKWSGSDSELGAELDTPAKVLPSTDNEFYSNIRILLTILVTLPVTNCQCKRSISMLRLIKLHFAVPRLRLDWMDSQCCNIIEIYHTQQQKLSRSLYIVIQAHTLWQIYSLANCILEAKTMFNLAFLYFCCTFLLIVSLNLFPLTYFIVEHDTRQSVSAGASFLSSRTQLRRHYGLLRVLAWTWSQLQCETV